ncbi:MAG: Crp/Fnr family transcriptional regulator [Geminicoccaceae bacterium]|nr:MAG: Crp/Fnr family transcriptional regulator [Geminicoccaceae bacterium]
MRMGGVTAETGCLRLTPIRASRCAVCGVREASFCAVLSASELQQLHAMSSQKVFEPGELIVEEDAAVRQVANVLSGTIKLFKLLPDGRQQITGFLFGGDFLGPMLSGEYATFAEAVTRVELCLFDQDRLREQMDAWPHLERRLFEDATATLDRALDWMLLLGRKTATERVASFFVMLADRVASRDDVQLTVDVPMSRSDIADYLGLTMETVSRQISHLKRQGLLEPSGAHAFTLPDVPALRRIAGGNEPN